jgi:hypothetical protein
MLNIKDNYNIKFNTTIIITADLINKFLANEFSFTEFQKEYNTTIFFKQPAEGSFENMKNRQEAKEAMQKLVPNFFPERTMFIKFLKKLVNENPELYDKMFNVKYRADTLYRNFDDEDRLMLENTRYKDRVTECDGYPTSKCGHLINYAAYIDSDKCMLCDKLTVF